MLVTTNRGPCGFHPGYHRPTEPEHPASAPMVPTPMIYEDARPARWEYRVVTVDLREEAPLDDERLGELGAEGWILTCVLPLPSGSDPVRRLLYHFARAI